MDPTPISVSETPSEGADETPGPSAQTRLETNAGLGAAPGSLTPVKLETLDPAVSSVAFGAAYVYSPHGTGPGCSRSRLLRARLKSCDIQWLSRYVDCVQDEIQRGSRLASMFGGDVVLVPIPPCSSSPHDAPWVALRLAELLYETGLARAVAPVLSRSVVVRKSATAAPGQRPTVLQHYRSLACDADALAEYRGARLLLVDDIVTKGRTFLAAAWRAQDSCPAASICAFALLRTMSFAAQLRRLFDPCLGQVTWASGDACRYP